MHNYLSMKFARNQLNFNNKMKNTHKRRIKWTKNKINQVRLAVKKGMHQKEVAKLFGCSQPTISRIYEMAIKKPEPQLQHIGQEFPEDGQISMVAPTPIIGEVILEKRKRGRPKKVFTAEQPQLAEPKKRRGRPKKVKTEPQHLSLDVQIEKKRRGRPKKVKTEETSASTTPVFNDIGFDQLPKFPVSQKLKRRGRPKKVNQLIFNDIGFDQLPKYPVPQDPQKSIDFTTERLKAQLTTAHALLQEISKMSWFQRKDCEKLIKGYFEIYGL